MRHSVGISPKNSITKRSQEIGLCCVSVHRILKMDLQHYPYRIQIEQALTSKNMEKHVEMCQWFESKIEIEPDFLNNVWFSDKAHFSLFGHVNSKNSRTRSSGDRIRQMKCCKDRYTMSSARLARQSQSMESSDHFGSRMMMGSLSLKIVTMCCSIGSGGFFVLVVGCKEKSKGFNKMGQLLTQQTSPWSGWIITFRIG